MYQGMLAYQPGNGNSESDFSVTRGALVGLREREQLSIGNQCINKTVYWLLVGFGFCATGFIPVE